MNIGKYLSKFIISRVVSLPIPVNSGSTLLQRGKKAIYQWVNQRAKFDLLAKNFAKMPRPLFSFLLRATAEMIVTPADVSSSWASSWLWWCAASSGSTTSWSSSSRELSPCQCIDKLISYQESHQHLEAVLLHLLLNWQNVKMGTRLQSAGQIWSVT